MVECDSGKKSNRKPKENVCKHPESKSSITWKQIKNEFEVPHLLRTTGRKQLEAAKGFIPSLVYFSVASTLGVLYFTDWKAVLKYMPYYSGKYPQPKDDD